MIIPTTAHSDIADNEKPRRPLQKLLHLIIVRPHSRDSVAATAGIDTDRFSQILYGTTRPTAYEKFRIAQAVCSTVEWLFDPEIDAPEETEAGEEEAGGEEEVEEGEGEEDDDVFFSEENQ